MYTNRKGIVKFDTISQGNYVKIYRDWDSCGIVCNVMRRIEAGREKMQKNVTKEKC